MKADTHIAYGPCRVHCACGADFMTQSVVGEIKVEICSECHPFYTGKQRLIDTGGRVDRFRKRQEKTKQMNKPAKRKA